MHNGVTEVVTMSKKFRQTQTPKVVPIATLLAVDKEGNVLLAKNERGVYSLPNIELKQKQTLENSVRMDMKDVHNLEVGTLSLMNVYSDSEFSPSKWLVEVHTIYYTEDFEPNGSQTFYPMYDVPENIDAFSKRVICKYYDDVQKSFMDYIRVHGDLY